LSIVVGISEVLVNCVTTRLVSTGRGEGNLCRGSAFLCVSDKSLKSLNFGIEIVVQRPGCDEGRAVGEVL